MAEKLTLVDCQRLDCLFHRGESAQPGMELCAHNDKAHYPSTGAHCPLYRVDWQKAKTNGPDIAGKKATTPQDFLKLMRKR